jgi:phenylacetate-CoA ligase
VVLPLYERLSGRRFWTGVQHLRGLQWRPREEIEARVLARLRALVEHAAANVPYYRDQFWAAGISAAALQAPGDLARLPVTTKSDLRQAFPARATAANLSARRRWPSVTSGSSGFPFEFFTDSAGRDSWLASYLFFREWAGTRLGDARVVISTRSYQRYRANAPGPRALARMARRVLMDERVLLLSGIELTAAGLVERVRRLPRRYFIEAYPSYLVRLAADLTREGSRLPVSPQAVIGVAETLTDANRVRLEAAFDCPVVSHYSAWEALHLAQSCPDRPDRWHVNPERAMVRVVDEAGRDVPPGRPGRVLVTELTNYVMPFINYELGDVAVASDPCPCGRGFPTLQRLEGRVGELICTPDGRAIAPGALERLLTFNCQAATYLWEYQARQTAEDAVTLELVPTAAYTRAYGEALVRELQQLFGPTMRVSVEPVAQIPREASGKRLVVKPIPFDTPSDTSR